MRTAIPTVLFALTLISATAAQKARRELRGVWIPNTDTRLFESRAEIQTAMRTLAAPV